MAGFPDTSPRWQSDPYVREIDRSVVGIIKEHDTCRARATGCRTCANADESMAAWRFRVLTLFSPRLLMAIAIVLMLVLVVVMGLDALH